MNAGAWQELKPGQEIPEGSELFTGVEPGVTPQFPDGSTFELRVAHPAARRDRAAPGGPQGRRGAPQGR